MKILISDDSVLSRKQLKDVITNYNSNATFVDSSNGQEAVDKYKVEHPDIVFLDIVMPVKNGVDSVKDIVAFDPTAKIVMVSSVGTQSEIKDALDAGAKDFIQKPIKPEQIENVIKKFN